MVNRVEALEAELVSVSSDLEKIDVLNQLARELRDVDARRGLACAQEAAILAEAAQDVARSGVSLANVSYCEGWLGIFGQAAQHGLKALDLLEQAQDQVAIADCLCALGRAFMNLGNYPEAAEAARRAQTISGLLEDRLAEAEALNIQGITYKRAGNLAAALEAYRSSLSLYQVYGSTNDQARLMNNSALVYSALGQYDEALRWVRQGMELRQNPVLRRREGYTEHTLGHIYQDMGSLAEALHHFQCALAIGNELENRYLQLDCLHQMGKIFVRMGLLEQALANQHAALKIAQLTESKRNLYRCHEALAAIYEAQGEFQSALGHYKQFFTVKEAVFNEESAGRLMRLEVQHKIETARKETEIFQLRNVELENEIAERKRLEQELEQQASTDELTGVMNRRRFLEFAAEQLTRASRYCTGMSLALIDIDHFKQINDTYGHAAGDRVLKEIAQICHRKIRGIDLFARFGGDEFVLLLPDTSPDLAAAVVERIREAVISTPVDVDGVPVKITLSVGISGLGAHETALDLLLARADQALYQAKNNGRNCYAIKAAEP